MEKKNFLKFNGYSKKLYTLRRARCFNYEQTLFIRCYFEQTKFRKISKHFSIRTNKFHKILIYFPIRANKFRKFYLASIIICDFFFHANFFSHNSFNSFMLLFFIPTLVTLKTRTYIQLYICIQPNLSMADTCGS